MYVKRKRTETWDDGHSIWQRNWLWHPHFLFQWLQDPHHIFDKINLPLWNCQSAQAMLCNTTVLFCWLIWWKCCEKMKIGTFDRLFHPSNCVFFFFCHPCSPFFPSFAYVWPKWSTFLHKTTWQFYPWEKNAVLCFEWPSLIVTLCCVSSN